MDDRARRRSLERHGAAALRAVSGRPGAELRGHRLELDGRPVVLATPYLIASDDLALDRARGIADALAAVLANSDVALHRQLSPPDPLARMVFDVLEQIRCESLVPAVMAGVRANIDAAFSAWCSDARRSHIAESAVGLLVYTVTHMVRARVVRAIIDEEIDATIETTRGNIGPIIGEPLRDLRRLTSSQVDYAMVARDLAERVAAFAGPVADATEADGERFFALVLPPEWDGDDVEDANSSTPAGASVRSIGEADLDHVGGYHVYSRLLDKEIAGSSLYPDAVLARARADLDAQIAAQAVSVNRVAQSLRTLFSVPVTDGWTFGQPDGVIDGRRLGQLVARSTSHDVFRRDRVQLSSDTVVSFLVDNSGSMKAQSYEAVAVLLDMMSRALDLAGVANEVLGFTTGGWSGGEIAAAWRSAGEPTDPGRLNQVDHIIYKDAETPWRRARTSLAAMMRTSHFREGVDGEALVWAHGRLLARPEPQKVLVVVSDGVPMDTATATANGAEFLSSHLGAVADLIERTSPVVLAAIAIDLDVASFYRRSIEMDLGGTLTLASFSVLDTLFGH